METINKAIQEMNVDELVEELMKRFSDIYKQLDNIEIQNSHQNKKLIHLESKVKAIKSLACEMQSPLRFKVSRE